MIKYLSIFIFTINLTLLFPSDLIRIVATANVHNEIDPCG